MLSLGWRAGARLAILAVAFFLGWQARGLEVEAIHARLDEVQAKAERRAAEIEAQSAEYQRQIDERDQRLREAHKEARKAIAKLGDGECRVPKHIVERLNALQY